MSKFKFIQIILFVCLSIISQTSFANVDKSDLAIVVPSCDKYSDLWQPFSTLLLRHWPELATSRKDINIYLLSNHKEFSNPRIKNIMVSDDISWSDNLIKVLNSIPEKYVLILLEDYFIDRPVSDNKIFQSLKLMQEKHAAYLQVSCISTEIDDACPVVSDELHIVQKHKHAPYRTSLQSAIWDKEVLLWLLKPGENPWAFELDGSIRSEGINQPFWAIAQDQPISYLNLSNLGVLNTGHLNYLATSENIIIENPSLPFDNTWKHYFKVKIKNILSFGYNILKPIPNKLKSLF